MIDLDCTGNQKLYFLMETALGGDLYSVYVKNALHGALAALGYRDGLWHSVPLSGSQAHAQFYSALVVLAPWLPRLCFF